MTLILQVQMRSPVCFAFENNNSSTFPFYAADMLSCLFLIRDHTDNADRKLNDFAYILILQYSKFMVGLGIIFKVQNTNSSQFVSGKTSINKTAYLLIQLWVLLQYGILFTDSLTHLLIPFTKLLSECFP